MLKKKIAAGALALVLSLSAGVVAFASDSQGNEGTFAARNGISPLPCLAASGGCSRPAPPEAGDGPPPYLNCCP